MKIKINNILVGYIMRFLELYAFILVVRFYDLFIHRNNIIFIRIALLLYYKYQRTKNKF